MEIEYTLFCEHEEDYVADHFTDDETCKWVCQQLDSGNEWAWFSAHVVATAEVDGVAFEGHDYLGGCSYTCEEDFRACDYFEDMCAAARADLEEKIEAHRAKSRLRAVLQNASENAPYVVVLQNDLRRLLNH